MTHWMTIAIALHTGSLAAAAPPRILELRTQKADGVTYFHVRMERPEDLRLPAFDTSKPFSEADRRKFARLPRLVPQDRKTRAVYYRHKPAQPSLSFCGQLSGEGKASFLLLYPAEKAAEVTVVFDFNKAHAVPVPAADPEDQHLHRNDLRSLWALHQGAHFAVLETQVLDFHFYSFAREATGRKYGVMAPAWVRRQALDPQHRLYEITTGADALAETLQLHRMLQPEARPGGERIVPVASVAGVTVPEQPWERLLAGKKPATEPIARLVPHDNYFVSFKDVGKFIEFGDLLDQWGASILQAYQMKSRDCQIRERYEKQLCLRSTALGKTLGPAIIKGLAVTGNDPYLREGSDVSAIFHVRSRELFLAAVEPFVREARKEFGKALIEQKTDYRDAVVESFVTPLREVSLHRAAFGEYVAYSNSPAAVRRILDRHAGQGKALADSPDFQHMRTVFAAGDKAEDGFVFLSDAFIRQLTGPASRIKEKRRLEALTSLYLLTNAALFGAWETGKLPGSHAAALAAAELRPHDIAVPEGKGARWDAERQLAVSDAFNTIQFATPLIELPIDKITQDEAAEYGRFREEYSKLWRTYFDPVGIRLSLDAKRVQAEVHILPLAGSDQYRALRQIAGGGTFQVEAWPGAVVDFRVSMGQKELISFYLGGSAVLRDMVDLLLRWEAGSGDSGRKEYDKLFWKLPIGVGIHGVGEVSTGNADTFVDLLKSAQLVEGEPKVSKHKEVKLYRLTINPKTYLEAVGYLSAAPQQPQPVPFASLLSLLPQQEAPAALHVAAIDKAVHVSADEGLLKKRIDDAAERKKNGDKKPAEPVRDANAFLAIGPSNAREAASLFLEYEGHTLSLLNSEVWNCFYQTGLLMPNASELKRKEIARQFLGFVPVSADGSAYQHDARLWEVLNSRHGSLRRPELHGKVAAGSELGKLLDQIKDIRAELRFLDNGLHTVLTIGRR